jgi:hypothetical protein
MPEQPSRPNPAASNQLHPVVYKAIIGLALWFVLAAWTFFGTADTELVLAIVTILILVAIAIPFTLSQIGRNDGEPGAPQEKPESFGDWASGEFDTAQDRLKAGNAAVEIVLPIAAVAIGITALGLVLHFVGSGAV